MDSMKGFIVDIQHDRIKKKVNREDLADASGLSVERIKEIENFDGSPATKEEIRRYEAGLLAFT